MKVYPKPWHWQIFTIFNSKIAPNTDLNLKNLKHLDLEAIHSEVLTRGLNQIFNRKIQEIWQVLLSLEISLRTLKINFKSHQVQCYNRPVWNKNLPVFIAEKAPDLEEIEFLNMENFRGLFEGQKPLFKVKKWTLSDDAIMCFREYKGLPIHRNISRFTEFL